MSEPPGKNIGLLRVGNRGLSVAIWVQERLRLTLFACPTHATNVGERALPEAGDRHLRCIMFVSCRQSDFHSVLSSGFDSAGHQRPMARCEKD